jgi:hypothetical protein
LGSPAATGGLPLGASHWRRWRKLSTDLGPGIIKNDEEMSKMMRRNENEKKQKKR